MKNGQYLSAGVQEHIEPPPIPLGELELDKDRSTHIIKVKIQRNPTLEMPETYNINMPTFKDGQPEEFLALIKNFSIENDGTGMASPPGQIKHLHMMLRGDALREFDEQASKNHGTTNAHLNNIT